MNKATPPRRAAAADPRKPASARRHTDSAAADHLHLRLADHAERLASHDAMLAELVAAHQQSAKDHSRVIDALGMLAQAQTRTETTVGDLAQAQKHTETTVGELASTVRDMLPMHHVYRDVQATGRAFDRLGVWLVRLSPVAAIATGAALVYLVVTGAFA